MTKTLEDKLQNDFPFMKRGEEHKKQQDESGESTPYDYFGCEVSDGWYSILYGMCEEITAAYERAGIPIDLKPVQVKEKFGELCFYYGFEDQAPDKMRDDTPLRKEIGEIVEKWEEKSTTVCDMCGKPGELRTDLWWVLTLCDDCYRRGNI